LLILGPVAALLIWVGISVFRTEPSSVPTPAPTPAPSEPAPRVSETPQVQQPPEAPPSPINPSPINPSPINEVIPDVPRSARETIRGTIRVSIRVIVDKEGTVLAASADEPGPSRYFERLAVEASKKWTFTPADTQEQRIMLVRFYFKRAGTSARASSLQ
jgi:TonB family protein